MRAPSEDLINSLVALFIKIGHSLGSHIRRQLYFNIHPRGMKYFRRSSDANAFAFFLSRIVFQKIFVNNNYL